MRLLRISLAVLLLVPALALSQNNVNLQSLYDADQAERQGTITQEQWPQIRKRDAERRDQVLALLRAGMVRTEKDYFNAAMVMQHGDSADDIDLAHSLATIAARLNPDDHSAQWLAAAAWDRLLMDMHKPQWYGTQYVRDTDGKWKLYDVDETAVTDADRLRHAVPPLEMARERLKRMNSGK